ncbi:MAG: 2-amino-4-hydroxy-6-hydroxymethyldihydropteridine diphosphokinase [Herpetosiphonaceae bacterium]|nr:2-amino-4-hydroxy-6-hydroxymethyldihydropteridine diphosphokinase [Herpetosiphonaceae bacterium]
MATVTLGLGSNLGDRLLQLSRAREALGQTLDHIRCSPIYETAPWGVKEQPQFLNAVCQGMTKLDPASLLRLLKQIEQRLGRVASRPWGPRAIDLDLLFYDDRLLDSPTLTVPHPLLHERAFVLVPLADLAPTLVHPRTGTTIAELRSGVDISDVKLAPVQWTA